MKKTIKKVVALGLIFAMSLSILSGCGSKKEVDNDKKTQKEDTNTSKVDINLNELLANVATSVADIEKIKVGMNGELEMTYGYEEMDMIIKGGIDFNAIASVSEPKYNLDGSFNYEMGTKSDKISGEHKILSYGETEDGELYGYCNIDDGKWVKAHEDISEFMDEIDGFKEEISTVADQIRDFDFEKLEQFEESIRLEDETQIVEGVECYVISADIDKDALIKIGKEYDLETDDLEAGEDELSDFNVKFDVYFSKADYTPVKFVTDVKFKIDDEETEMTLDKLKFEITLGINSDDDIKPVPKDVKSTAIEEDAEDIVNDLF